MAQEKRLQGWGQIAARVSELARMELSTWQAMRLADREHDPLPVTKIGRFGHVHIVAEPEQVAAWAKREFVSQDTQPAQASQHSQRNAASRTGPSR